MLYQLHEFQRAMLSPLTAWAQAASKSFANPSSPFSLMPGATRMAAAYELMYRLGKDYEKPEFNIHQIVKDGHNIPIVEQTIVEKPFCRLLRFKRYSDDADAVTQLKDEPVVLVCAPLSGHHSTLLRDTVRTLLQDHKVYITDWIDARMVPVETGPFHLHDYIAYIQEFIRHIGARNLHVISVCQPTVPVLAAISLMASRGEDTPLTMTMMGGPIDARRSPTSVNSLATQHSTAWFENNVIHTVPANYPGEGRQVYPGFLQHTGFVAMNPVMNAIVATKTIGPVRSDADAPSRLPGTDAIMMIGIPEHSSHVSTSRRPMPSDPASAGASDSTSAKATTGRVMRSAIR